MKIASQGFSVSPRVGRIETETLEQDPYSYDVESDFWEWEEAETFLRHYTSIVI